MPIYSKNPWTSSIFHHTDSHANTHIYTSSLRSIYSWLFVAIYFDLQLHKLYWARSDFWMLMFVLLLRTTQEWKRRQIAVWLCLRRSYKLIYKKTQVTDHSAVSEGNYSRSAVARDHHRAGACACLAASHAALCPWPIYCVVHMSSALLYMI